MEEHIHDLEEHKGHSEKVKRSAAHDKDSYVRTIEDLEIKITMISTELTRL